MPVDIIAPDGGTLEDWGKRKRKIRDTEAIVDTFKILNDTPYWLTNFKIEKATGMNYETPRAVPPHSDTATIKIIFDGREIYDNLIQEIHTQITCESHVAEPSD